MAHRSFAIGVRARRRCRRRCRRRGGAGRGGGRSLRRSRVQGRAKQFLLELDVEVAGADGAGVGDERDEGLGAATGIERGGAGDGGSRRARQELGDGGFLLAAPARAYLGEREHERERQQEKKGKGRRGASVAVLLVAASRTARRGRRQANWRRGAGLGGRSMAWRSSGGCCSPWIRRGRLQGHSGIDGGRWIDGLVRWGKRGGARAGYEVDLGGSRHGRGVVSWLAAATGGMGQGS